MAGYSKTVTITRTADTNAYGAADVIGAATGSTAALTFADVGGTPTPREMMITTVSLLIRDTALIASEAGYRLYLYNILPPSALGDNTAWDLPAGDRASFIGYVDLGTPVDLGSTLYVQTSAVNTTIATLGSSIFGYLVTIAGYTPSASRVYDITLHTVERLL